MDKAGVSGSDLTMDELERTAIELAATAGRPPAPEPGASRSFEELRSEPNLGAWLIHWGDDADTGFHDHDRSSGAVHVISGRVREDRLRIDGPPVTAEYGPGETFSIDSSEIHRVVQIGDEPALTVHAYSPPLDSMGAYAIEPSGALTRHSVPYEEELRPLDAA